jgi:uncharacterized protein
MRFFLDANVLFSASKGGSNVARFVASLFKKGEVVTSDFAIEEARRNLTKKCESWLPAFERLCSHVIIVPSIQMELDVTLDTDDIPILSAAIGNRCTYLVTGDHKDFKHLFNRIVSGVQVVTMVRLAQILTGEKPC